MRYSVHVNDNGEVEWEWVANTLSRYQLGPDCEHYRSEYSRAFLGSEQCSARKGPLSFEESGLLVPLGGDCWACPGVVLEGMAIPSMTGWGWR